MLFRFTDFLDLPILDLQERNAVILGLLRMLLLDLAVDSPVLRQGGAVSTYCSR